MARKSHSPTHLWLMGNTVLRVFGWLFLTVLVICSIIVFSIISSLKRDCDPAYKESIGLFDYNFKLIVSSSKKGCPS